MIVGMAVTTTVESRAATAMAAMIPAVTSSWSRVSGGSRSLGVLGGILRVQVEGDRLLGLVRAFGPVARTAPWALAVHLVDGDVHGEAGRNVTHRELLPGPDVELREPVHHVERAAGLDRRPAADHEVRVERLVAALVRLERQHDPRVAPQVVEFALVGERGPDDAAVVVDAGPGERDVRRAIGVEGDDVGERAGREELARALRDRCHEHDLTWHAGWSAASMMAARRSRETPARAAYLRCAEHRDPRPVRVDDEDALGSEDLAEPAGVGGHVGARCVDVVEGSEAELIHAIRTHPATPGRSGRARRGCLLYTSP